MFFVAEQSIRDYGFSLSEEGFGELVFQARNRLAKKEFGAEMMEELAASEGGKPRCPRCGSRFGLLSTLCSFRRRLVSCNG